MTPYILPYFQDFRKLFMGPAPFFQADIQDTSDGSGSGSAHTGYSDAGHS